MIEYENVQLKTRPSISVSVPKGYEEKAKQLIDTAINNPENLATPTTINEHPYLRNIGILSRVKALMEENNPVRANELQDIILLRIGIYANEQLMRFSDSEEKGKVLKVDSDLIRMVEDLENHR